MDSLFSKKRSSEFNDLLYELIMPIEKYKNEIYEEQYTNSTEVKLFFNSY